MREKAIVNIIAMEMSHVITCKQCPLGCEFSGYKDCRLALADYFKQLIKEAKIRDKRMNEDDDSI